MKRKLRHVSFWMGIFFIYVLLTAFIFRHRVPYLNTRYAMPDVDTDGGLWYQWFLVFKDQHKLVYDLVNLTAYPFGYDIAFSPVVNLIYSVQAFILKNVLGFSWQNLILITNLSTLLVHPFSALGAALLTYYHTKNKAVSFLGGLMYGFCFYLIFLGRGEMSINHLEFVPFYFLSLFYFLDRKNTFSLTLSVLMFSITFQADAYYAFFSGIFSSLILLFYKKASFVETLRTLFTYYFWLFLITFLTNFNFVVGNLYMFDHMQLIQTGRNSQPRNELLPLSYYFTLQPNAWLIRTFGQVAQFLALILPTIAYLGITSVRKNRLYLLLFGCYLLAIALSAYIPDLFWLNILYFQFFGMFRGVARLNMFAFLFLNLLITFTLAKYFRFEAMKKHSFRVFGAIFLLIIFLILLLAQVDDATWDKTSDFSEVAKLYQPLKDNPNIHAIAPYPMVLGAGDVGFPGTYQLLGQIIHNKPLASGVSPFSQLLVNYRNKVEDINNPQTIDFLTQYGVDTIVLYNKHIYNSDQINARFKQDPRLQYVGHYTSSADQGFISALDLSKDISVYQIKSVVEKNRHPEPLFFTAEDHQPLPYDQVSAQKYILHLNDIHSQKTIVFNSPYSEKWKIYKGNLSSASDLSFLKNPPIFEDTHLLFHEYQNSWSVDPQVGTEVTIFFAPQARYYLGDLISSLVTFGCICIIIIFYFKPARKKVDEKI